MNRQLPEGWSVLNQRRAALIRKELATGLDRAETEELAELQAYTKRVVRELDPLPREPLEEMQRVLRELGHDV